MSRQTIYLGEYKTLVDSRLKEWRKSEFVRRLWEKDYTLWSNSPYEITDRLGWLDLPYSMKQSVPELMSFAEGIKKEGFEKVVLFGMGGSSLAPWVFQSVLGNRLGYPELIVLDSTHPVQIKNIESRIDGKKTLFIVSSKSGTTLETITLFQYFFSLLAKSNRAPGGNFIAITDPGTPLERLAGEHKFRRCFAARADVGGRFSALTEFGLVPASIIGVYLPRLLARAGLMADLCSGSVEINDNPAIVLGAVLGELAIAGRDKLTFITSPGLRPFVLWIEQLVAESTGKQDKGILPVLEHDINNEAVYSRDRVFIIMELSGDSCADKNYINRLKNEGHPVVELNLKNKIDLGQEIIRWEIATSAAGAILGIHPFNQPDVQLAKDMAKKLIGDGGNSEEEMTTIDITDSLLKDIIKKRLGRCADYDNPFIAIQAFIAESEATDKELIKLQNKLRELTGLVATFGYGPRFLHSTGQLHKGGNNNGIFIQLVDTPDVGLDIPGNTLTFDKVIDAQSRGDYLALVGKGRNILRVTLGNNTTDGLARLNSLVE